MRNRVQWRDAGTRVKILEWKDGGLLIPEVDEEDAGIIQRSYVRALLEQARIAWGMLAEAILRERRERRLFDRMTTVRGAPIRVPMRIPVRG